MANNSELVDAHTHTRRVVAQCLDHAVTVTDFQCRACRRALSEEECNVDPSIVFVRRGVFIRDQEGETVVADANHVLFFNPLQPYRIAHPVIGGDDCTIVTLSRALAHEIVARHAPRQMERLAWGPFPHGYGRAGLSSWRMHYEMLAMINVGNRVAFDDFLLSVIDRIVAESHGGDSPQQRRVSRRIRYRTTQRHRDLAHAAVVAINRNLADPPGLSVLAATLGCSTYHLSRVFREVIGSSLRVYLAALRARAAADAIARGARGLTQLALQLGYADHSHFSNAFYKEWQVSPSRFRDILSTGDALLDDHRPQFGGR
jgi:AraC-like DNA-binding protein